MQNIRPAAVAGTWYPDTAQALTRAVDGYLSLASADAGVHFDSLTALIAPHAGLMYSGPVAAHAYGLLPGRTFEVIVIDVPETARALFYGAVLLNGGSFWMDSAEFNVVDKAVPLTGRPVTAPGAAVNTHLDLTALRAAPENLDFEQTEPLTK